MDPLVSNLIVACIVGVVSGGMGAVVTNAVQNQRLKSLEKRADKIDDHLDRHDVAFSDRVLFKDDLRDKCAACSKLDEEQHKNVLQGFQNVLSGFKVLKKEVNSFKTETVEAFRSCTDDLIEQLKEGNA